MARPRISEPLFMTQANKVTSKKSVRKTFLTPPPYSKIPKDIATKRGETTSGIELYHHATFHADIFYHRRDIYPRTNTQQI